MISHLHQLRHRLCGDAGSAMGFGLLAVFLAILFAGVVLDGGTAMATRVQALDIAQQAARAGANQLDLTALRERGQTILDPAAARNAATAFLAQANIAGTATATLTDVTVTVTRSQPTTLLQLIGKPSIAMTATAHATPVAGP
jgi:Flp pilus assembly protein TadG